MVIVTRQETPYVDSINALAKEKIAVVDGYASHEKLKDQFPQIELLPVDNVENGLIQVIQGKVFAFITENIIFSNVSKQRIGRGGITITRFCLPGNFSKCIGCVELGCYRG